VPGISLVTVSVLKLKSINNTVFILLNQSYFNLHFDMAFFFPPIEIVWYRMCALMWALKIMFQHGLFSTVYLHRCISRILCLLLSIIKEMFHVR
jgi:hypothetical protein